MLTWLRLFVSVSLVFLFLAVGPALAQRGRDDGSQIDPEPRLSFKFGVNERFGITVLKDAAGKPLNKKLTYNDDGGTNNLVVKIDGKVLDFGNAAGKWVDKDAKFANGSRSSWEVNGVLFSQILEIVPSQQPVDISPGVSKRLLDTCLIRYIIENKDNQDHKVGLRIQVDTLIGTNDGVPFTVPSLQGLVNTQKDFRTREEVPEFIQALEVADLQKPGTVGLMTLKVGGVIEPPDRVSLTYWPGGGNNTWDLPMKNMESDSAVVIYWNDDRTLNPGGRREVGFAYGLGRVASAEGVGKLALTVNGSFLAGEPFTVTAYVQKPAKDQILTLELPPGLERVEGKQVEAVPPATEGAKDTSVVTWKVKSKDPGQFTLKVNTAGGVSQSQQVTIQPGAVVDDAGKFTLTVSSPLELDKPFTLTATVKKPLPKQSLTLELPPGLERVEGDPSQDVKPGAADAQESTVVWKVKASKAGNYTLKVRSSTGLTQEQSVTFEGGNIKPIGGGKFTLAVSGPLALEKTFTLTATVKNPLPKQTLNLIPPPGLVRVECEEQQSVPALPAGTTDGETTVTWKLKAQKIGEFTLDVLSSNSDKESKTITIADVKKNFTLLDARRALQMSVGNLAEEMQYDVDSDGRVTSLDAAIILQRVAEQARKGK